MSSILISILDVLEYEEFIEPHNLLLLTTHSIFLENGFMVYPETEDNENPPDLEIRRLQDGAVAAVILPTKWKLEAPLNQNISICYSHYRYPKQHQMPPRKFHLKAVLVERNLTLLAIDSSKPDDVLTLSLSIDKYVTPQIVECLNQNNMEEASKQKEMKTSIFKELVKMVAEAVIEALIDKLLGTSKNEKPKQTSASTIRNEEVMQTFTDPQEVHPIYQRPPHLPRCDGLLEGEHVGPNSRIFRRLRDDRCVDGGAFPPDPHDPFGLPRTTPVGRGIRFDPLSPLRHRGYDDPDDLPRFGGHTHFSDFL